MTPARRVGTREVPAALLSVVKLLAELPAQGDVAVVVPDPSVDAADAPPDRADAVGEVPVLERVETGVVATGLPERVRTKGTRGFDPVVAEVQLLLQRPAPSEVSLAE